MARKTKKNSQETLDNNSIETLENNSIETLETTNNGSLYIFNTYLNCLSMTLDGTYKLYPSKYIALSGGSYEDCVSKFNTYLENNLNKSDERFYETQRVLPFCLDNSGNPIKNDDGDIEANVSDPNYNDGEYIPQTINTSNVTLGTIICGGDINFLNHTVDSNEIILYVSQSDIQEPCYITKFNTENLDISNTIFVDNTGVTNPNYENSNIKFNAVFVFFNVYRKVGESIDELDDCWLRDMPGFIYVFDEIDLSSDSQKEWCTRIFSSFVNDSFENTSTISTTDLKQITEDIAGFNRAAQELESIANEEYTDLKEVKEYYTEFKNNRHVNVPYIQGNWWYVNGKKAGKAYVDANGNEYISNILTSGDEHLTLETTREDDGIMKITGSVNLEEYLTKEDVSSTYQPILSAGTYITLSSNIVSCTLSAGDNISISSNGKISAVLTGYATDSDLSDYLTKSDASSTYQPLLSAGTYISLSSGSYGPNSVIACTLSAGDNISISATGKISAVLTGYATDSDLSDYLTKSEASSTYQTLLEAGSYISLSSGSYGPANTITCTLSAGDNISISDDGKISAVLDRYVTQNWVTSQLNNYVSNSNLENILKDYVTENELEDVLVDYITKDYLSETLGGYQTKLKWYEEGTSGDRTYGQIHNCEHAWMRCHFDTSDNMVYWANVDCDCYGDSGNTSPNSAQMIAGLTINDKDYANNQSADPKRRRSLLHATEGSIALRYDYQNYDSSIESHYYSWLQLGKNYFHVSNSLGLALCIGDVPTSITGSGVGIDTDGVYCKIPGVSKYKRMLTTDDLTRTTVVASSDLINIDFQKDQIFTRYGAGQHIITFDTTNGISGTEVIVFLHATNTIDIVLASNSTLASIGSQPGTSFTIPTGITAEIRAIYAEDCVYVSVYGNT